jgi:rhamnogalacturonyl hydrolase YesR
MRHIRTFIELFLVVGGACFAREERPSPESVKGITQKVADWQIATFDEHGTYRALAGGRGWKGNYPDLVWHMGALYTGMIEWWKVSDDPDVEAFLMMIGNRNDWKLYRRPYHADDHTVGQFYLSLYEAKKDPRMVTPTKERFDWILEHPKTGSLEWDVEGTHAHDRWGWCDALFMAPPVWARLANVTGDRKYLDFMDQEYHATYDLLWDQEDKLFWRDSSYFLKREKNGSKLYWSRGNGWVFGGLALMIPDLPIGWEGRSFYMDLFKEMAESIKNCQRDDGTWSMGMLGGVEGYPIKESSGTSFFVYGMAWGINNGLLDRATYEPVVIKGWNALTDCVNDEGMLGYVQPVGAAPGDSNADKTEVYGIGAFLAAGSEVYKLVGGMRAATSSATFCRFVPEREDDFAWENDKIAFRAYGPALRKSAEDSGFDAWLKRVDYPIVDKWYRENSEGKSYHKDHGEGYDPYTVGSSRGCGGLALWVDGEMVRSNVFKDWKIVQCSPEESVFILFYEYRVGEDVVTEEKQISIQRGDRLFKSTSTFKKNGVPAASLPIAIGLVRHHKTDLVSKDLAMGWMSLWEPMDNSELGTGVVIDPERIDGFQTLETGEKLGDHILLTTQTDHNGQVEYYAGYGWKKAGEIKTSKDWNHYLSKFLNK